MKTRGFSEPKYVGDPINAVKIFNEKAADELFVVDIDASVLGREPDLRLIKHLAIECRMPLCYGGGVKSLVHAREIVGLGVEKIALSSAAIVRPTLISEIANEIGVQSVVVVVDARSTGTPGEYDVWTHKGSVKTGRSVMDVVLEAQAMGAGEIVINSIDRDGQMTGYDLELAEKVKLVCRVPLTILGGAGSLGDIEALIRRLGVVGAAAGSLFVFKGPYRAVLINYPNADAKDQISRAAYDYV